MIVTGNRNVGGNHTESSPNRTIGPLMSIVIENITACGHGLNGKVITKKPPLLHFEGEIRRGLK